MEYFCDYCNKKIEDSQDGIIYEGKAYHNGCRNLLQLEVHAKIIEGLQEEFPDLEDILPAEGYEGLLTEELVEAMREKPWIMIYKNDVGALDVDSFDKKSDLFEALSSWFTDYIADVAIEIEIVGILYRKKVWWAPNIAEDPLEIKIEYYGE